jgi:hypothetical protein
MGCAVSCLRASDGGVATVGLIMPCAVDSPALPLQQCYGLTKGWPESFLSLEIKECISPERSPTA